MKGKLLSLGLNSDNSVVIGSGILQALGIRDSKDIDLVVTQDEYDRLKKSGRFEAHETQYKREVLKDQLFEIGTSWDVLDKKYRFNDFGKDSVVIDGVRYVTLDFLYRTKESWLKAGTARPKDINDLELIEEYRNQRNKYKGTIVQESLIDDRQLNNFETIKFKVTNDEKFEDRWHLFTVMALEEDIKKLASNLKPAKWYAHFWNGDDVIAIFPNKTFNFKHSDKSTWKDAIEYGKSLGIPEEQLDFLIEE